MYASQPLRTWHTLSLPSLSITTPGSPVYPFVDNTGNRALWIVPLGVKALLRAEGVTNCVELDWWQKHTIKCPGGTGKLSPFLSHSCSFT